MQDTPKFLLVDTGALPPVFLKVVEAKEMLCLLYTSRCV